MIFLLDTNAISDLMRQSPKIEGWLFDLNAGDRVVTCTIVQGEILFGIERSPVGKKRNHLKERAAQILASFECLPVPVRAAEFYASIKFARQKRGLPLDENDQWIASTAIAIGATLVTRDADFANIDGLAVITQE